MLSPIAGFKMGDALASAVIVALATHRMAVYDRRAQLGLERLQLSLTPSPGRYGRYMALVSEISDDALQNGVRLGAREIDLALFRTRWFVTLLSAVGAACDAFRQLDPGQRERAGDRPGTTHQQPRFNLGLLHFAVAPQHGVLRLIPSRIREGRVASRRRRRGSYTDRSRRTVASFASSGCLDLSPLRPAPTHLYNATVAGETCSVAATAARSSPRLLVISPSSTSSTQGCGRGEGPGTHG
jgi:hypothetical protein